MLPGNIDPEVIAFLQEWYNEKEEVIGHTSGSTGKPKGDPVTEKRHDRVRQTNKRIFPHRSSIPLVTLPLPDLYRRENDDRPHHPLGSRPDHDKTDLFSPAKHRGRH